jgi:hypothetical protein
MDLVNSTELNPMEDAPALLDQAIIATSADQVESRKILRNWLFHKLGESANGRTIADALHELNRTSSADHEIAVVLIRCVAVHGLLPEPNSRNQITRLVTEICELNAPELCKFLDIQPSSQNFEKYAAIEKGHAAICHLLTSLVDRHGDLQSLVAARKPVLGALNHSIVRAYCNPFRLQEIKSSTEALFGRLDRVILLESSFLQDLEECNRTIYEMNRSISEHNSFLSPLFRNLVSNSEHVLDDFLNSVREKYHAKIRKNWGASGDLQKRYPLHVPGREFHILVPLRNEGTGLALGVQVTLATSSDNIVVSNQSINLGSVQPGDFSVVLDAMVASSTSGFDGLLEVQWNEIGNPERLTDSFEFQVKAQSADIDWASLEYVNPYSTNVAKGDSFIGRSDLVSSLSSKLLRDPMEPFYITGQRRVGKSPSRKFMKEHNSAPAVAAQA